QVALDLPRVLYIDAIRCVGYVVESAANPDSKGCRALPLCLRKLRESRVCAVTRHEILEPAQAELRKQRIKRQVLDKRTGLYGMGTVRPRDIVDELEAVIVAGLRATEVRTQIRVRECLARNQALVRRPR